MRALTALLASLFGLLVIVSSAAAQSAASIAVAADDDCIAVYSEDVERRLLRVHFDQAAGKASFSPFGPTGIETFAVAPKGAFVVYAAIPDGAPERTPHLFVLDASGQPGGTPVPSPIGAVAELAVSPKGDWVAASSARGWISLFAVERAGSKIRLRIRATFGVSADRPYTYAFRPDGGLVTMTDDWVMVYRSSDGAIQRVVDLKTLNRDLTPAGRETEGLFRLKWSPRGDRFMVSWGGGPMLTTIFDAAGHRLQPSSPPGTPTGGPLGDFDLMATDVEFIDGGNAAILAGMTAPVVVRMTGLTVKPFVGPDGTVARFVALAGGHRLVTLNSDGVTLWSDDGKRLIAPAGFENYAFDALAAGTDDEAIVSATRGGWIDLFTKQGKFVRRFQSGSGGPAGKVAVSADGNVVAALGSTELHTLIRPQARTWQATIPAEGSSDMCLAMATTGNRVVTAGPDATVRSWSRDGGDLTTQALEADGLKPGRLAAVAVSPQGDAIAVAAEEKAIWLVRNGDSSVRRITLPARPRAVAPLPQGGFVAGLTDGTIARLSRDGALEGTPVKASEFEGVGRITVAPDGQSLIVVEEDEISARHLDWNGQVLAGPFRANPSDRIKGAFFDLGRIMLILSQDKVNDFAGDHLALRELGASPGSAISYFEQPR